MSFASPSGAPVAADKRMKFDDVAWDRADELFAEWKKKIFNEDIQRKIGSMIIKHRRGVPVELFPPKMGGFNLIFRMVFIDGGSAVIRFPVPGSSAFREEKVRREVSVMRFLERHTNIRIPPVLHYGMTEGSPAGLGPFIVMEYTEHDSDICDALNDPRLSTEDRPILDPNISVERLKSVYGRMADIILQMAKQSFAEIGSITNNEEDEFDDLWTATDRPLTNNMNELVQLGNFPTHLLPQPGTTYNISSSYFLALAEMHMNHLSMQRNDAVESTEHCRQNSSATISALQMFLSHSKFDYAIVGAIDWEFCYAAPAEFTYSPPFWLLLELPEYWEQGLEDWTCLYEKRLTTFLDALEEREREGIERGVLKEDQRLSQHMKASWESGDFWVSYAARKSWAFDMVCWAKIDRRFFGDGDMDDRIELLTVDEREGMDEFVKRKMAEKEERVLTDWTGVGEAIGEIERETEKDN